MFTALRVAVVVLVAAATAGLTALWIGHLAPEGRVGRLFTPREQSAPEAPRLASLAIGGPFTLSDPNGRTVTQSSFPGQWLLIYFGYTSCPDVCPTTLQAMAGALQGLGAQANRVVPLFITVDPARDRPEVLGRYTALFDRRIVGLTGTVSQLAAAEKTFRVYAARVDPAGGGTYVMDHTSFVYLIDPQGHLQALFDRTATATEMTARMRKMLT